ncbi:NAD(P)H-hydrate dehydratase [Rhodoplanes serenus]|uniref:Bifunctional NAD(P)H-hydrate repair enzyme n=1 Tax=Rhodoplanes serenus TaxID=200615 RepID=A0A9X4XLT5_9BRAD|nr:NAD(P)H-hydrate dehydratase [Rhodoplanes serenus]MTW16506.1 NAD(P)H-hydrate dehydratase [Rhodoplanes serenus]
MRSALLRSAALRSAPPELLTTAEMGRADRSTIESGTPGIVLMENAGRAVAEAVMRRHPPGSRVVVLAGPGNNGGDGFVAARRLAAVGFRVTLLLAGAPERLKGDAAEAAHRWAGLTQPATPEAFAAARPHVIVDALFGAGLDRPVEGVPRALIDAVNAARADGAAVVAVDLPSGVNGTTGAVMGAAIEADESVTFFRAKPGHWLLPGRLHRGRLTIADIGIPDAVLATVQPRCILVGPELVRASLPVPSLAGHKYDRGHVVVVSGGGHTTGAARLAARAALRVGAGLVTLASPADAVAVNAAANVAVMVRQTDAAEGLATLLEDRRFNAVALGPGLGVGAATRDLVGSALAGCRAVVLDADALTSFVDDPEALFTALRARPPGTTVLTPHDGEFSRLFDQLPEIHEAPSKLDRVRAAARRTGGVVLLKGADTTIADLDGCAAINANAPAHLATAGAGDVLTGLVAGLLAQGLGAFTAAATAAWLHGEAARLVGPGLIAEDLSEVMPSLLARLIEPPAVAESAHDRVIR